MELNSLILHPLAVICVSWTHAAFAGSYHHIDCPSVIEQKALRIAAAPAGWSPYVRSDLRLTSAEPTYGPPSEGAFLKPSASGKGYDKWSDLSGPVAGGKWFVCNYGQRNEFSLARRIDDRASECTVRYKKDERGNYALNATCKW